MSKDLQNKLVVVTGGARGIGLEISKSFLENGARVILLDVNEAIGKEAMNTLTNKYGEKADFKHCDVTKDLEAVSKEIFDKYKYVDVLVNNAGVVDEFDVKRTININLTALIEWSMKFFEHMRIDKGGKGGTILNIASIYGYVRDPYVPFYKASKHGVMGFTKTFGHEYNFYRFGVRSVAICPGFTSTNLIDGGFKMPDERTAEDMKNYMKSEAVFWQTADVVGKAAVEVFKRADSGTAWKIDGGKPIEQVQL